MIRAEREADAVVISVRDNGIGIEPEMQASVFDVFTQARQTLDRSQGGLGLGLAIVRSLVTLHGGTVTVLQRGARPGHDVHRPAAVCGDAGRRTRGRRRARCSSRDRRAPVASSSSTTIATPPR